MDNICILLQMILGFYVFYKAQVEEQMIFLTIGVIVGHFIFYLLSQLTSSKRSKSLLYIGDIGILIFASVFISSEFWVVAIARNVEWTYWINKKVMVFSTVGLFCWMTLREPRLINEQGILLLLTILFLVVLFWYEEKVQHGKDTNQQLREKLYQANHKLEYVQKDTSQIEEAAKLQERNLLVQKLHDKVGHTLAANIMQLEAVKILLRSNEDEALKMLEGTIHNLRVGMDDIRYTLRSLKPERSEMGINQVKGILEDLQSNHAIETELLFEGNLEAINLNIWQVIIQNLKEAVTNLLKYSEADRLTVRIDVFHKVIKVQFKDNGRPNGHYEKGLGLMGMEERTQSINGRLVINTGNGFEVLMVINREDI